MLLISILALWVAALLVWLLRDRLPIGARRGWLIAIFPLVSFGILVSQAAALDGRAQTLRLAWIPTLELSATIYFDALSALFALLVSGIGTLIVIYTGYYSAGDRAAWRLFAYLLIFMGMMLGVVLAGDVLTLFVFWEGTSISSFLLVAYKTYDAQARQGAFKSLLITGGGGIALLVGLLFVSSMAGSTDLATILAAGERIRQSEFYLAALGLVAFGAFTKSAQFPAHIWLPSAMSAPTPASAFLHSATMVKAGIYLMARLNPALGNTEAWFWLMSVAGMLTMVAGAYLGVKQDDLKKLLAYSTISQLGVLMMLIGQDTSIAFKALVIGVVAHALYKSALFMGVGIIDQQLGTRKLSELGGLRRSLPLTFGVMTIAALSLAGLPPLLGFLAKETLLATAVHPTLPTGVSWLFAAAIVFAAALKLVQAGLLTIDVFLGDRPSSVRLVRPVPIGMVGAMAVPALFSLAVGVLPEPLFLAQFFGDAAAVSYGGEVKVSLALWTGLSIPLALSLVAIGSGGLLFRLRRPLVDRLRRAPDWSFDAVYRQLLIASERLATLATRLQSGRLQHYLRTMLAATLLLVLLLGGLRPPQPFEWPSAAAGSLRLEFDVIRLLALLATVGAALATVVLKRDLFAVLALSAAGLGVAVYMAVEPAPDVALVQIVVDILATVILILALSRTGSMRRSQRPATDRRQWANLLIAAGIGLLMTVISYDALITRPRGSSVSDFYAANSKSLTGASDVVGAIIVDFRALDTLIELAVFGLAGLGVYTLLHSARSKYSEPSPHPTADSGLAAVLPTRGIGGEQLSVYIQGVAQLLLPAAFMIALVHVVYGHQQPGDGFTAGVIVGLAIALNAVVFGFAPTRRRLRWLQPSRLIAAGLLLVVFNGAVAVAMQGTFLAPVDYGSLLAIPLPTGAKLSSGFLFEAAIMLTVVGSAGLMLESLGRTSGDSSEGKNLPAL